MNKIYFFDEVHDFQRFIRENIYLIGNYTIISEQLMVKNNEIGIIDMLAIDNDENRITIIELKNTLTTDKNIWQPIRYYDLIKRGEDSIKELLINASSKLKCDICDINVNPKVVLIVPRCNEQLLRTLSYFDDIDLQVIEISRFENNGRLEINKKKFFPKSIFHKEDLVNIKQKVTSNWNFEEYYKKGINKEKLDLAFKVMNQIKQVFLNKKLNFDVFFTETKITIIMNNKVWGYLFVKQKPLDHNLVVSFKLHKDKVINKNDFLYHHHVESVDVKSNSIKLCINGMLNNELIDKCI